MKIKFVSSEDLEWINHQYKTVGFVPSDLKKDKVAIVTPRILSETLWSIYLFSLQKPYTFVINSNWFWISKDFLSLHWIALLLSELLDANIIIENDNKETISSFH